MFASELFIRVLFMIQTERKKKEFGVRLFKQLSNIEDTNLAVRTKTGQFKKGKIIL
jgi:hypothetical protein